MVEEGGREEGGREEELRKWSGTRRMRMKERCMSILFPVTMVSTIPCPDETQREQREERKGPNSSRCPWRNDSLLLVRKILC
eukprot:717993-Hanusia_phi.AAC.14